MNSNLEPFQGRATVRPAPFRWWIMLIIGIVVVAAAIGLMASPFAPVQLFVLVVGAALAANGLAMLVRPGRPGSGSVVGGVVLVVAGIVAMVFYELTAEAFVIIVAAMLISAGVLWAVVSVRAAGRVNAFLMVPAVLTVVAGVITLAWPEFVLTIVAVICGFFMLFLGISLIAGALQLRKMLRGA